MSPLAHGHGTPRLSSERFRHQKPRRFWLGLFAGSLGLHLGTALLAPTWWRSLSPQSSAPAPLPIELVDVSEIGGVTVDDAGAIGDPAMTGEAPVADTQPYSVPPSDVVEEQAIAPQPAPVNPVPANPVPVNPDPVAPVPVEPAPQPPVENPNPFNPSPPQATQPSQEQPVVPQPQPPIPGSPPVQPPNDTGAPGDVTQPPEGTLPPGSFPETGLPSGGSESGTGELPGSGLGEDSLPEFGIGQDVQPVQLRVDILSSESIPMESTVDAPQIPAQLVEASKTITADPTNPNSCVVPPDSVASFGAIASLLLVVNDGGQVVDAFNQGTGANPAYVELAQCLVRNFTYQPATSEGIPRADNQVVSLTIQSAQ